MSKTPRTDKATFVASLPGIDVKVVDADFARQLETELAEKDRQLAEAWAEIERLKGVGNEQVAGVEKSGEVG